ncbi:exonuclease SbcCD, D subunit [Pseudoflavonifractor capillosus ATCC 29799]|uniref:Nuclease SbcCD subunit D n=1 Tax=Pseudoflavonifractor capillosus ATCC 29799 TaxID=411467 RepID=A6P235_9FIRM|nr:exonuclease SbcCD subunit D [Pseudoflavonifractor capillosus]EDM97705.1 exonuclease SbcCD, D subunit [Pseudoflavonifractor capillosus ATCC 29799]
MKLIHLSDLHLGKRVNDFSMLEDQQYILAEILQIIDREKPDGVLIAGDVYDKSVPSAEAVALLDDFLVRLSRRELRIFVISGNHDSPERMAFGGRLMERSGVHLAPVYDGRVEPVVLTDQYGPVKLYLLPFVKPSHVRRCFPEREIATYTDAVAAAIEAMGVDTAVRNVLVTHQFVTGAARCDSEELSVGGTDNVDAAVFDPFDYVALGHIHGPQQVGRETVRYCGTPLKYSFSEAGHKKSVTVVELGAKGAVTIRTIPLKPLRDMVELRGTYEELTLRAFYEGTTYPRDYIHITLTDEEDIPDAVGKLRIIYPNLMKLDYDNKRTRAGIHLEGAEDVQQKSPLELLEEFYSNQNGQPMSEEQRAFARDMMERIWEEDEG